MSWLRTGATAGVAVRYLALPEAVNVAIIGSGRQARSSLMAVHAVRNIQTVRVFSPTPEHRNEFAREMNRQLKVSVLPVETPQEAVRDAQVIITATSHRQPVFFGSWLEPGATIIALGSHDPDRRELDGETMEKADLVVVDHLEQARIEQGELILAREEGLFSRAEEPVALGEVVAGKHPGRRSIREKIVFLSGGIALEYLTVGFYIYKKVRGII